MSPEALAAALKARARDAGAALAGLAPARPLPEASAYHAWIAAGRQAGMAYMAKSPETREDITRWYPEARSVLVCAFAYADNKASAGVAGAGRVARYAALPDYHPELRARLQSILSWLKEAEPGADGRAFVDTSPLLERLYARYAGLGWIGKNTMLVSPRRGSYLFLAGLALNRDLPADEPLPDHCGTCTRCLSACPTQAFPAERVLDAGRCVAYFTIEHRGAVPEGFREGIGDWVMGCDVCQEVCPWNRFASAEEDVKRVVEESLPLEELALLDDSTFKSRFKHTALSRAKRRGLVRNALLAMGNSRDPRHRPVLERLSGDPDPVISEQASWSLSRLPPEGAE